MRVRGLRILCLAVVALGCAPGREHEPAGAQLYHRYCASCHGTSGAGDGPAAQWLEPRPANLRKSTLDLAALVERIDGRREVPGHGSSDMPVWGKVFSQMLVTEPKEREITRLRVQAIAEHVHSLRDDDR
jgi:hypothetical protein